MMTQHMSQEVANLEARYQRLRADVKAARDMIGDTPMPSAGNTAVTLLERVLKRHPINPNEGTACLACSSQPGQYHAPECPAVDAFTAGRIRAGPKEKR